MRLLGFSFLAVCVLWTTACTHKELCEYHNEHAHRYHVDIKADYRLIWEELNDFAWQENLPAGYLPYQSFKPEKPEGLRAVVYSKDGASNTHNLPADGGVTTLYEGENNILFYNNNTEYIVFSQHDNGATTRATTRTRTRSTYLGNTYGNPQTEETVTPPDMLFANYITDYRAVKTEKPVTLEVTLHPLVFTYKIRYEFESGLEYVSLARGALSGMARSVLMNTGTTTDEVATLLYDCELTPWGARTIVKSFGVPNYPNPNYATRSENKHALNLELMLKNGKMIVREFDVTEQVKNQPHGGVIVVKGITVAKEEGMQGSGAFDVVVNGWGEYEDIPLPL